MFKARLTVKARAKDDDNDVLKLGLQRCINARAKDGDNVC